MDDQYAQIKLELQLTKAELEERLNRKPCDDREKFQSVAEFYEREKNSLINQHIQAELQDVNRALLKMEFSLYGICEETGVKIPFDYLKVLPTVRTLTEAEAIVQFPYMCEQPLYC